MKDDVSQTRTSRRLRIAIGLVAITASLAAAAGSATAATHDYCNWDGSYNSTSSGASCFQSGENNLTLNHAYMPYLPATPLIYCAANSGGSQYGNWSTGGNPACDHVYGGGTLLKAKEMVSLSATTHGVITY
jgi:hypothetical protein